MKGYALFMKASRDDDRGATIFGSKEEPIIGIEFLHLVLEAIFTWGNKFTNDKNGNPTKYNILLKDI